MRYEYKTIKSMLNGEPIWRGYYRLCWPFPWIFIQKSFAWNEAYAISACWDHAKARMNSRMKKPSTMLGRLPMTD